MEMSINNAKAALANPPDELKTLLADERVPKGAKESLKAAGLDVEKLKSDTAAGSSGSETATGSRLQVVDEHQNFS
jgi:hypothetical protein